MPKANSKPPKAEDTQDQIERPVNSFEKEENAIARLKSAGYHAAYQEGMIKVTVQPSELISDPMRTIKETKEAVGQILKELNYERSYGICYAKTQAVSGQI